MQRARWTHPDLHDELVEELVSLSTPLAAVGAAAAHRTAIGYTFLLLVDQNAGKSTFLHAFANAEHAGWLELLSILPILSASFCNAQFRTDAPDPKGGAPAMDQGPFLHADVGRTSFLLTLEDFSLFVDAYELRSMSAASVRYAAVELIEIVVTTSTAWWRDAQLYVEDEASMAAPAMSKAMLNVTAMR